MTEPIRIELPTMYGMKSVNAYLFLTPELTLIDCGEKTTATWEALQAALAVYDLAIKDIKRVIITHAHVDHIGMAGRVSEESGAKVWVNEYCYDWAVNTEEMWKRRIAMMEKHILGDTPPDGKGATAVKMLRSFFNTVLNVWDTLPAEKVTTFPMEGNLEMGGATWQIIYAPGHTNMQTCFYQAEKKWLIGADMLLSITPTPVIEFSLTDPEKRENGLATMLKSYQKMLDLEIEKVFPGHYEPFGNHRKLIQNQLRRINMRKETTYQLIEDGKTRFYELFDVLYANRLNMPAMSMLRGYLDLLIDENRIEERMEGGYLAYRII